MLPRLKAEEQLAAVDAAALAAGHYDKGATREKLRALRDAAMGSRRRRAAIKGSPAQLGQAGIGVRMLPPPQTGDRADASPEREEPFKTGLSDV